MIKANAESKSPSLYPTRTHTTPPSSRANTLRTRRSATNLSAHQNDDEALAAFKVPQLEEHDWYWNLGLLVFGMAILITGDIIYDFPSAPLTPNSWGTDDLALSWRAVVLEYAIWLGLIALILFVYTAICLTFDQQLGQLCCEYVFGRHRRVQYMVLKITGYAVVVFLLAGTMAFDALLFYAMNAFSAAYYVAVDHLLPAK